MEMTIDCPTCGAPLRVPETAAGRKGRCTQCKKSFQIPSVEELLDSTVSHFMVASIEADEQEDEAHDTLIRPQSPRDAAPGTPPETPPETPPAISPDTPLIDPIDPTDPLGVGTGQHLSANDTVIATPVVPTHPPDNTTADILSSDHLSPPPPPPEVAPPEVAAPELAAPEVSPHAAGRASGDTTAKGATSGSTTSGGGGGGAGEISGGGGGGEDRIDITQDMAHHDASPDARQADGSTAGVVAAYPQDLRPTDPRPYLTVRTCTMGGVRIAFDGRWLAHEVFRTSMPIRGAFTGDTNTRELLCRPMIFLKKHTGPEIPLHSIETRHELKVATHASPRALARAMGPLDHFTKPFHLPILYYVTPSAADHALDCQTHTNATGQINCDVLIPNHRTALQWIERVNGRCGPEYALLKTDIAHYTSDAWRNLPDKTRQRIGIWCRFEKGESFKLYLNDPDFTLSDAGLAGVVVTDRRMIYHKYRRSRSISLNQNATLHVSTDGTVARLSLQSMGRVARCGKIHRTDLPHLVEALAGAPKLSVQVRNRDTTAVP